MRIKHAEKILKLPETRNWNYQFKTVLGCSDYGITRKKIRSIFLMRWPSLQIEYRNENKKNKIKRPIN